MQKGIEFEGIEGGVCGDVRGRIRVGVIGVEMVVVIIGEIIRRGSTHRDIQRWPQGETRRVERKVSKYTTCLAPLVYHTE